MSFRDIIEGFHKSDPSVRGGALAGADGLSVEEWQVEPGAYDLSALCAEMVQLFRESDRVASENGLGEGSELSLSGAKGIVMARRVTRDYFLLLLAEPSAIPGKCRFLLRRGSNRVREAL